MKKVVLMLFAFLLFTMNQVFAYRISDFSSDVKIQAAMKVLEEAGEVDVFRNLQRNSVRIKFDDLSMVAYNSHKCFAVSTYNQYDRRIILINSKYKNAPAEQIACLIAHESFHVLRMATLEEETIATQKEAACWSRLKVASKAYPDSSLTKRLDKLAGLYLASDSNNNYVEQKIADSSFYRSQLGLN